MENEQLDVAKRTLNEAIRFYDDFNTRRTANPSSGSPHQVNLVISQAQLSLLLKLKIGRLEVAVGTHTKNDRLTQSGGKTMKQCTCKLRGMLQYQKP